jgi:flagellar export protein FliJ
VRKFEFRLESVLEYRETLETAAKNAYLVARREALACEREVADIEQRRLAALQLKYANLPERRTIETILESLDDREREVRALLCVLQNEEAMALAAWQEARRDVKVLEQLREKAHVIWQHEVDLEEQNQLDEWTVMRRVS